MRFTNVNSIMRLIESELLPCHLQQCTNVCSTQDTFILKNSYSLIDVETIVDPTHWEWAGMCFMRTYLILKAALVQALVHGFVLFHLGNQMVGMILVHRLH